MLTPLRIQPLVLPKDALPSSGVAPSAATMVMEAAPVGARGRLRAVEALAG